MVKQETLLMVLMIIGLFDVSSVTIGFEMLVSPGNLLSDFDWPPDDTGIGSRPLDPTPGRLTIQKRLFSRQLDSGNPF